MRLVILDLDELEKDAEWDEYEDGYTAYSESAIKSALVDAERHGKWINDGIDKWKCSLCQKGDMYAFKWSVDGGYELQDNYCPNCGALMDLVDQETEE